MGVLVVHRDTCLGTEYNDFVVPSYPVVVFKCAMSENIPSFENIPSSDLERISADVAARREMPEHVGQNDQELLKHALRNITSGAANRIAESSEDIPAYMADAPSGAKRELEHYLQEAVTSGIDVAAAHIASSSPFLMDAFHDALVGPLYELLKQKGMLK